MEYKILKLKKGREIALQRKHPWIFSGALQHMTQKPKEGETIFVADHHGTILATGHYADSSIAVRILSFGKRMINTEFYTETIGKALQFRKSVLNLPNEKTNCFRLIAGEGDNLPGLIVDIYNEHAVIQCHSQGMLMNIQDISKGLQLLLGESQQKDTASYNIILKTIFLKAIHIKHHQYEDQFLLGSDPSAIVLENGVQFYVNWVEGQKTGFFLDQRENRLLLGSVSEGKTVLNTFCYTGGFSAYALHNNAAEVLSIDISESAMEATEKNIELNCKDDVRHTSITGNVMEFLKEIDEDVYDIIILDPPAFAKNKNKSHNAVQAYKRLNLAAMKKVKTGGMIFTFSCSQVIDRALFENTIRSAAIESGRDVKFVRYLNQAPDHVINAFHQEGHYLKGLVVVVD